MNVSFPVHISDFPSGSPWAHLNGSRPQTFTWSAILRAAMVAGYPELTSLPSLQFVRWRTAALRMALRHSGGILIQPPEWDQLDPSEKGAVSSILGVVMTKLLVERLLDAPLFLFLDVHFSLTFPQGLEKIRPDFAAMTTAGQWFGAEAKGQQRFRRATLEKGKRQAKALGRVNGQPVRTGVVCVTSFCGGQMVARFADPSPKPGEFVQAHIKPMEAVRGYYNQLDRFREFSEPMGESAIPNENLSLKLWQSPELDVKFGVIAEMEKALEERSTDQALSILKGLAEPRVAVNHPSLGADGIVVIPGPSWYSK